MLPKVGAGKIIVFLLVALSVVEGKQRRILNDVEKLYNENLNDYVPSNVIRLGRFYAFYDKPTNNDDVSGFGNNFDKRRDRPRPMRFGK
uniref:Uncharacterized protein n=1 Tax=Parastrongyloides trichosuri TaxID=131310 RepID=A0A0N4Z111_PARTI